MAATVPAYPDLLIPDGSDIDDTRNQVRNSYPVAASHWEPMGRTINWLRGHGAQIVAGNSTFGSGYGSPVSPIVFRHRILGGLLGLNDPHGRSWFLCLWADQEVEVTVTFQVSSDAPTAVVSTLPGIFRFDEVVSGTLPSPPVIGFNITWSGSAEVYCDTVSCFEIPLTVLQSGDGVDLDYLQFNAPIYYDASNDGRSVFGALDFSASELIRRTVFNWYNENGVTLTDTAFTGSSNLFLLDPAVQARHVTSGQTTSTVDWAALCTSTGGGSQIRLTTAAGSDTQAIAGGGPAWVTGTIDIETDDPSRYDTDGGIRGGTRDSVIVELRRTTATNVIIYALVIGDA